MSQSRTIGTREAADIAGVSTGTILAWWHAGRIINLAPKGGTGHAALWLRHDIMSAARPRKGPAFGRRGRAATVAEVKAAQRMRQGIAPTPPRHLPYRALAKPCPRCGRLVTATSILRSVPYRTLQHPCGSPHRLPRQQARGRCSGG